jgi:hypothetical protein
LTVYANELIINQFLPVILNIRTRPEYDARYDNEIRALQRDIDPQRIHHSSSSHAAPPPSHPQPPPPTIGQGQNNIFGAIMSGGGGGNQVLVAPPQMMDQPPPGSQSGHPGGYPGPNGPPQSVPQSGGSSAQSPYLNGSGPAPLTQQQHGPKRQRMEDGPPPNMGLPPNSQQPPSSLYSSNGMPPQGPTGQQSLSQSGYMNVGQSSKPVSKMSKVNNIRIYISLQNILLYPTNFLLYDCFRNYYL